MHGAQHDDRSASQNATSIGNRMPDGVDLAARPEHERAVERVAAEQPAPARPRVVGDLGRRQHLTVAHEPGHRTRSVTR